MVRILVNNGLVVECSSDLSQPYSPDFGVVTRIREATALCDRGAVEVDSCALAGYIRVSSSPSRCHTTSKASVTVSRSHSSQDLPARSIPVVELSV
jgi:hypothetical protein